MACAFSTQRLPGEFTDTTACDNNYNDGWGWMLEKNMARHIKNLLMARDILNVAILHMAII